MNFQVVAQTGQDSSEIFIVDETVRKPACLATAPGREDVINVWEISQLLRTDLQYIEMGFPQNPRNREKIRVKSQKFRG